MIYYSNLILTICISVLVVLKDILILLYLSIDYGPRKMKERQYQKLMIWEERKEKRGASGDKKGDEKKSLEVIIIIVTDNNN